MADLRIYELTDTQASYSPDIYLAVSDSTFTTGDKKVKMSTIYPLIDTLSEATDINPATSELRISISAGNEQRMTVNNLLKDSDVVATLKSADSLGIDTTAISFTNDPDTGISIDTLSGKRSGKLQVITGRIVVAAGTPPITTESKIASINNYNSPGFDIYFTYQYTGSTVNEGAFGKIDTSGNIYITAYKENTWAFTAVVLGA
jgi:hypothetical protein